MNSQRELIHMERGTRWLILQEVNRKGRAGVEELAQSLGVRPSTIHHHLPRLEREGLIRTQAERHGQGRPRLVCSLTDQGQALFPQGYRWLADELLQAIAALDGPEKVDLVFQRVGDRLAARYRPRMEGKDPEGRVQEVAGILTELGFDAAAMPVEHGFCLCDGNCPVLKIAERYPQMCAMELRLLSTLLGKDVQRTEYRLEGAPVCTHLVTSQN
jgi:predicted ArsR family transcriptional regulator